MWSRISLCLGHSVGTRFPRPHAHIQSRRLERANQPPTCLSDSQNAMHKNQRNLSESQLNAVGFQTLYHFYIITLHYLVGRVEAVAKLDFLECPVGFRSSTHRCQLKGFLPFVDALMLCFFLDFVSFSHFLIKFVLFLQEFFVVRFWIYQN